MEKIAPLNFCKGDSNLTHGTPVRIEMSYEENPLVTSEHLSAPTSAGLASISYRLRRSILTAAICICSIPSFLLLIVLEVVGAFRTDRIQQATKVEASFVFGVVRIIREVVTMISKRVHGFVRALNPRMRPQKRRRFSLLYRTVVPNASDLLKDVEKGTMVELDLDDEEGDLVAMALPMLSAYVPGTLSPALSGSSSDSLPSLEELIMSDAVSSAALNSQAPSLPDLAFTYDGVVPPEAPVPIDGEPEAEAPLEAKEE